jgi:hypothetical protein
LVAKAEKEFFDEIEQEKKLREKRQQAALDMDKGDTGKVGTLVVI